MPSREAERILSILRKTAPVAARTNDFFKNLLQNVMGFVFRVPRGLTHRRVLIRENVKAEWTIPEAETGRFVILYCHGGGYVAGNLRYTRILAAKLARVCGVRVFSAGYRLAPRYPFPAALQDCLAAYRYLIEQGYDNVVIAGESAGGGLTLTLPRLIDRKGLTPPRALAALSPWIDLSCTLPSYTENADIDPTLSASSLRRDGLLYAGREKLTHPMISPLFADFTGYPPTLLQAGDIELLLDDTRMAEKNLRRSGVPVECEIFEGLWHGFQLLELPESNEALASIGRFFARYAG